MSLPSPAAAATRRRTDDAQAGGTGSGVAARQSMNDTGDPNGGGDGPVATPAAAPVAARAVTRAALRTARAAAPRPRRKPGSSSCRRTSIPIRRRPRRRSTRTSRSRARRCRRRRPMPTPRCARPSAALTIDATTSTRRRYVAFAYYHKKLYDTAELVLDDVFKRDAAQEERRRLLRLRAGLRQHQPPRAGRARVQEGRRAQPELRERARQPRRPPAREQAVRPRRRPRSSG